RTMHARVCVLLLAAASACRNDGSRQDAGPPPAADQLSQVRTLQDQLFARSYRLDGPPAYRFAEPVQDRVARWHFEPEGQQPLGYCHGWCVEYWVTPGYAGYPKQPESHRMAFFCDGRLRGLFTEGLRNAPLDLDRWAPSWVDTTWRPQDPASARTNATASP